MNKRTKAYIFAAMFMGMMMLPRPLFIPLKDYVDTENYENRVCQERPVLKVRGIKTYSGSYGAYSNGRPAFKNPLMALVRLANIRVFGEVSPDVILMGQDDWMFHKFKNENEDSPADHQGTNRYPEERPECFARLLEQTDHHFTSRDIRFILYIVPSREQAYSEYMPPNIKVVDEESKADRLLECLRSHTDANVYYPLEKSKRAKDGQCQVYRKYDTHWNDMGVFPASQMMIRDIDNEKFGPESCIEHPIKNKGSFSGDLVVMLNLQNYYNDDPLLKMGGCRDGIATSMDYESERDIVTYYSLNVQDDTRKVLICRDSFGIYMTEYFAKNHSDMTSLNYHTEDCGATVMDWKPDVVVIEATERYTDYMFRLLDQLASIQWNQSKECASC